MKEYKIWLEDYDFFLKMEVYSSTKAMIDGCDKYAKNKGNSDRIGEAIAIFYGVPRNKQKEVFDKRRLIVERELGKLFFCKEFLTYDTIAHECFHAAFEYFKSNAGFVGTFHPRSIYGDQNEEYLNCIFTDIYATALRILRNHNYKVKLDLVN